MIKCLKCGYDEDESKIQLHHIIPKSIGGTDMTRIYLCEKCHNIVHNMLPKLMWRFVDRKDECKTFLINYFEKYRKREK